MTLNGKWNGEQSLLEVDCENVWVDAVKRSQDGEGVIIRVHEFEGKRSDVQMHLNKQFQSWTETDLMENEISDAQKDSSISFTIKPYEIKIFKIK